MCNGAMLTGLDWISDGEKVITDRHGVAVGMEKMFKCPYHKQSECPFRLRVLQTAVHGSVSYTSELVSVPDFSRCVLFVLDVISIVIVIGS